MLLVLVLGRGPSPDESAKPENYGRSADHPTDFEFRLGFGAGFEPRTVTFPIVVVLGNNAHCAGGCSPD